MSAFFVTPKLIETMLYYNSICENYDDFKSRYYDNCGRKRFRMNLQWAIFYGKTNRRDMIPVPSNDELMHRVLCYLRRHACGGKWIELSIGGICYYFPNDTYESDHLRCVRVDGKDGLRLIKDERVWGVKYGKMLNTLNATIPEARRVPQHILNYAAELFAYKWRAEHPIVAYELHVDDDFERIYTSDEDFGSCMRNEDQWSFYRDAVDASACYLTDKNGDMVARAVRFNKVRDIDTGEKLRLLERQYSVNSRGDLKQMLVDQLIAAGEIDGYKAVDADCSDSRKFVGVDGTDWSGIRFEISCRLDSGDTLSYQDSFKWYDESEYMANNYGGYGELCLNTTDCEYDGREEYLEWYCGEYLRRHASREWVLDNCYWSEYHEEYLEDALYYGGDYYRYDADCIRYSDYHGEYFHEYDDGYVYVESKDDYYYDHECVCDMYDEYILKDDAAEITYGEHEGEYVDADETVEIDIDGYTETVWEKSDNLSTVTVNDESYYFYVTDDGDIYFEDGFDEDNDALTLLGMAYAEDAWHTPERAQELLEEC